MRIKYSQGFTLSSSKGLSLLELVIGIAIASLLLAAIYIMVGRGFTISRELTEQNRITEDARINARRLARLIQTAHSPGEASWVITSGPHELAFLAQVDEDSELEHIRIFLEDSNLKHTVTQLDKNGRPVSGSAVTLTIATSIRNREVNMPVFTLFTPASSVYPTLADIKLVVDVSSQTKPDATTIQTAAAPRNLLHGQLPRVTPAPSITPNPSPPLASPTPSIPPGDDAPPCDRSYDLMIVLDESGSLSSSDFEEAKRFGKLIADSLLDSEADSRLGLITFARDAKTHIVLTDDLPHALRIIGGMGRRHSAGTNISAGFRSAGQELQSRGRADVADTIIMVTDGLANRGGNPEGEANKLKSEGVRIFAVHVGNNPHAREATKRLASGPDYFFDLEKFAQLPNTFVQQLYKTLCQGSLPPVSSPSPTPTPTPRPTVPPGDGPIENPL